MVKRIFLDLDDTIFDFKACERQALSSSLSAFSLTFSNDDLSDYSKINDLMWKALEKGEITREVLRVKRFELFLARFSETIDATRFADTYMDNLSHTNVLIDGARDLLAFLSENYDLYAVTNGYVQTQNGRIQSADIGKYFKSIFISQSVGAVKPKKEFFDCCIRSIPGFSLAETVLIGDSPTSDIRGGNAYGITTIRYNPAHLDNPPDAIPDYEVYSLGEIPALLKRI